MRHNEIQTPRKKRKKLKIKLLLRIFKFIWFYMEFWCLFVDYVLNSWALNTHLGSI